MSGIKASLNVSGKASFNPGKAVSDATDKFKKDVKSASNNVGNAASSMGKEVCDIVNKGADAIKDGAKAAAEKIVAGTEGMWDQAKQLLTTFEKKIPHIDLESLKGKISLPHVPPRPDIRLAMNVEIKASLEAKFGVKNAGWPELMGVLFGSVKADGSFTLKAGNLSISQKAELSATLKALLDARGLLTNLPGLPRFPGLPNVDISLPELPNVDIHLPHPPNINLPPINLPQLPNFPQLPQAPNLPNGNTPILYAILSPMPPGGMHGTPNVGLPDLLMLLKQIANPLVSSALSMLPQGLEILMAGRKLLEGGMVHLRSLFEKLFGGFVGQKPSMTPGQVQPRPNETEGMKPTQPGEVKKTDEIEAAAEKEIAGILNNPALSFEDKLFLYCLAVAKKNEKKIDNMIKGWEQAKTNAKNGATTDGTKQTNGTTASTTSGGAQTPFGSFPFPLPEPSQVGSMVGGVVGMAKKLGSAVLSVASMTAPLWVPAVSAAASSACAAIPYVGPAISTIVGAAGTTVGTAVVGAGLSAAGGLLEALPLEKLAEGAVTQGGNLLKGLMEQKGGSPASGTDGTSSAGGTSVANGGTVMETMDGGKLDAKDKDSDNQFMQKLTHAQQQLTKMYEMCSTLSKSLHDTQMSSIRNMR